MDPKSFVNSKQAIEEEESEELEAELEEDSDEK